MLRRYMMDQPTSRLAVWSRRVALFSLLATVLAIIIVRSGLLEVWPALTTFGGALAFAALALLLALAAFVVIWREGLEGIGYALTAIAISAVLLAYPTYLVARSYKLPRIYDISTDTIDPPRYEALARIRPRDANPIIYAGLATAEQQRASQPIPTSRREASACRRLRRRWRVTKRRWRVVEARAATARAAAHRGGRAHADHGLCRRCGGAHPRRRGRLRSTRARPRAMASSIRDQCGARPRWSKTSTMRSATEAGAPATPVAKKGKAAPKPISRRPSDSGRDGGARPSSRPCRARPGSSRCASTERPAALASRGSSPT
jgi:hypothetical protein